MAFIDAMNGLDCLVQRGIIRDYAVIGSVAAAMYIEPRFGENIDVIVLVDTDEEYLATFQSIAEEAEGEDGTHYVFGGIPIQFLPSTVTPLYRDTIEKGRTARIGDLAVKVATAEHLLLLYLLGPRVTDRIKALNLRDMVYQFRLNNLIEKFDDEENTLAARLQNLRGTGVPREGEMASQTGTDEF